MTRLVSLKGVNSTLMLRVPVTARRNPIVKGLPPVILEKTNSYSEIYSAITIPKIFRSHQKYYAIEILPPELMDSEKSYLVAGDSPALLAILMSSFYPIWVKAVNKEGKESGKVNPTLDYNNFPFPEFSKKQGKLLEEAGGRIHRARGSLKGSTLSEAYQQPTLPEHLVMAHEELDRVVKQIFQLPEDASEEVIIEKLFENYLNLFQNF